MPRPDSLVPSEWIAKAEEDMCAAELLLTHDGPLGIAGFLVQQAVEKYLKAYLIASGWPFRRIHDLEILIEEAATRDAAFAQFVATCQRITEYYIEGRYPIGLSSNLTQAEIVSSLEDAQRLATLVCDRITMIGRSGPGSGGSGFPAPA